MLQKSKLKIIVPLNAPEYYTSDDNYNIQIEEYERILQSFENLSNDSRLLKLLNYKEAITLNCIEFKILLSKVNSKYLRNIAKKHKFFQIRDVTEYLQIKCELNSNSIALDKISFEIDANRILKRICFLLNITYKGPFTTQSGLIYGNGHFCGKTDYIMHMFDKAYGIAIQSGWPRLNKLDINKTLDWFEFHNIQLDKLSNCSASKAINALTYLINDHYLESDSAALFWAMVGIESVFAKDNDSIQNQIKVKTSLVFGEPQQFKKKLSKLYDYRSRLIHGDINFPPKFSSDILEEYDLEYWDNCAFASSILLATIREMIYKNKNEFVFNYSFIDEDSK